ncbi:SRPBCC family protein [Actinosynnema pretiosum subsp. pretiosum]|uniref:Polyketide cyclase/dehydrase n=2 Tax=Actinosynnema TaxID=40566 RepID=C6WKY7_ACTMD|nr:SRPBCC family protein [Actinosynnema mirum]ACU34742.1 hypothetical protein Amir_0780 [Actinosynnema mirum DSM 43827]AXX28104.1 hypothetical protein APASM_0739 [Actinosynnema pretiosum subsp. pretiosum]QUF07506.1 SRPBCC family protein [Actinosynnema pretiosum subsp. pretiosum]
MTRLELTVPVAAPARVTWAAVTDWERQGEWILATSVRVTSGPGRAVGDEFTAVTGIGRFGVVDPMRITRWEPPSLCAVEHLGRVVRGTGEFRVAPAGESASEFTWVEDVVLPAIARPAVLAGVRYSLTRFARFAERYRVDGEG